MAISITKPTIGGSEDTWGTQINAALDTIVDGVNLAMPSGGIIMWSGTVAAIPTGWYLCDGNNGTPNLVDRFVMGKNTDTANVAGSNQLTLTTSNLPSHNHTFSGSTAAAGDHAHAFSATTGNGGSHTHTFAFSDTSGPQVTSIGGGASGTITNYGSAGIQAAGDHTHFVSGTTGGGGTHTHTFTGSVGATGSGTAFDNRPAFYALAFIMKA